MSYRAEKDKTHSLSVVHSISNIMPRHWIVIIADWIHLLSLFPCSSRLSACSQKCLRLICTSLASPTTSSGTVSLPSLPLWKENVTSMGNPPHFLAWTTHRGCGMSSDQRRKRLCGSRALSWVLGAATFPVGSHCWAVGELLPSNHPHSPFQTVLSELSSVSNLSSDRNLNHVVYRKL